MQRKSNPPKLEPLWEQKTYNLLDNYHIHVPSQIIVDSTCMSCKFFQIVHQYSCFQLYWHWPFSGNVVGLAILKTSLLRRSSFSSSFVGVSVGFWSSRLISTSTKDSSDMMCRGSSTSGTRPRKLHFQDSSYWWL